LKHEETEDITKKILFQRDRIEEKQVTVRFCCHGDLKFLIVERTDVENELKLNRTMTYANAPANYLGLRLSITVENG
jgi:hypothetical protein